MEDLLLGLNELWENRPTAMNIDEDKYEHILLLNEDEQFLSRLSNRLLSFKYKKFNVAFVSYLENHGYEVFHTGNTNIKIYKRGKILNVI